MKDKKFVRGNSAARKYVNAQLKELNKPPIKKATFLKHVRSGKLLADKDPEGEGSGTRYDFYLTDLDDYVKWLVLPFGQRFPMVNEPQPEKKSRFGWFGLNE